jgi:hypothetical protein
MKYRCRYKLQVILWKREKDAMMRRDCWRKRNRRESRQFTSQKRDEEDLKTKNQISPKVLSPQLNCTSTSPSK